MICEVIIEMGKGSLVGPCYYFLGSAVLKYYFNAVLASEDSAPGDMAHRRHEICFGHYNLLSSGCWRWISWFGFLGVADR